MRKSLFTEEQMVAMLRDADRTSVAEVVRNSKVTEQTIYSWRQKFGALEPADIKRSRELENENARLNDMLADRELAIDTLKEISRREWRARRCCATKSTSRSREGIPSAVSAS